MKTCAAMGCRRPLTPDDKDYRYCARCREELDLLVDDAISRRQPGFDVTQGYRQDEAARADERAMGH